MSDEPCAVCKTSSDAMQQMRIVPRRDTPPLTNDIKRAVEWPGSAMPVDVVCCGKKDCYDTVRKAAVTILSVQALSGTIVHRTVQADE